ncbi:MAG TPA: cysteine--tRNA ligase [Fimbriimonadaceae bacterium]|nr:cysteine--tRNA ligase [Fimbriimonadaceae bacterium]
MPRSFRLYDTMTRTVKELQPLEPGHLKFYSCGPTVYSYAHIGNFRSFLTADLIVRTAKAIGWRVTWVTNITDVGHLTDDDVADAQGEDKMERALRSKEGERFHNIWELSEYYTEAYKEDWRRLNLTEPDIRPKATQHVREQILAAEDLIRKGHAYETPTGVYFSVASFPDYGKLSGNTREKLKDASRDVVLDENKRDQADFAVWKKDDKHLMQWYSPYGWGFPGWHIECSVMARAYLGDTIDLHSGGEDNIFPHHECEIAQSESLTGKPLSNHWVHTRFLQVNAEKMSKRFGNISRPRELVEEGVDPLAIRYALISGVYNKPLNFTDQSLVDAVRNVQRFRDADALAKAAEGRPGEDKVGTELRNLYDEALDAMCNDLNTAVALAKALEGARLILREGESLSEASAASATEFLDKINALLGIVRHDNAYAVAEPVKKVETDVDVAHVEALITERAEAKKAKNFARADEIRRQLDAEGIELRDTPDGTVWVRK